MERDSQMGLSGVCFFFNSCHQMLPVQHIHVQLFDFRRCKGGTWQRMYRVYSNVHPWDAKSTADVAIPCWFPAYQRLGTAPLIS